uniref:Pericentrin n=1 Tax=Otolemur garnettii TaxID=30611 RepID=H0WJC9_OTOGA
MEGDEQERRRRKVEAGRAKLAHFRQRKTKGDCANSEKKTAKRKGSAIPAPVQEESPVAPAEDGVPLGGGSVSAGTACTDSPDGVRGVFAAQSHDGSGLPYWEKKKKTGQMSQQIIPRKKFLLGLGLNSPPSVYGVGALLIEPQAPPGLFTLKNTPFPRHNFKSISLLGDSCMGVATVGPGQMSVRSSLGVGFSSGVPGMSGPWGVERCGVGQTTMMAAEHEQEHEFEIIDLMGRPNEQQQMQLQPAHSLELEALRLSLSNMHTVQLELAQANLQKEKETALTELREMLNSRRAQELALLQSRQQHELGLIREEHAREKEEMALRCSQETAELKEKLQSEMEKNVQIIETLKQDWESERDLCLEKLHKELSAKHQLEMEDLRKQFQKELGEQRAELEKSFQAQNQTESAALQNSVGQKGAAVREPCEDLPCDRCCYLEGIQGKLREKEKEKQLELETLQASYEDLKAQSQEEIRHLWAQLDSARANRQELNEFQEQLQARASRIGELELLKQDLEQQQQQERAQHESDLEQLRVYFEEKLRDAEKSYREDLILLQQRLQDMKEDSFLEAVEISASCTCSEETPEREKIGCHDQLVLQPEQHKESLACPPVELGENHRHELEALQSWLCKITLQTLRHVSGDRQCVQSWGGWPWSLTVPPHPVALAVLRLPGAQDAAEEADWEVATRDLGLETEHKVELSLLQTELKEEIKLLNIEKRNLYEKLQHEIRAKEDLEQVKHNLLQAHQEELNEAKEKSQLMKQEFKQKEAEWRVRSEGLKRDAEEKLALLLLDLREQAAWEQRSLRSCFELREAERLAVDEAPLCGQCGREPPRARAQEDCALQLMLARSRFLEERKEITEKFKVEQDAFLREAQEQHAHELQLLQERHQQQLQSVTQELEARHQAELRELAASMESEQQALLDARVAELQIKHASEVSALERRHLSNLDSLASRYLSEIETARKEHRWAIVRLRTDFKEQLQKKDAFHQMILTQELEKLRLEHDKELQSVKGSLRGGVSAGHGSSLQALELPGVHQAPQGEFDSEKKAALHAEQETYRLESERAQPLCPEETESLSLQLQEKNNQIQQLKEQVLSLSHKVEECHSELETLRQRRERENQEGENLISMLKTDADLSHSERRAVQDALKRVLVLFGETLETAIALKSQIGERVGLCLDGAGTTGPGQALWAALAVEETWSDAVLPDVDGTLSGIYQSLSLAVDGLLDMVLDSTRQLEEARQIHSCFEKEFRCKSEEAAQVLRKHGELLQLLEEAGVAKAGLQLQLHQAQGILEGLKVEKVDLQAALDRKEESEQGLVLQLESLREEHALLQGQKEEREAGSFLRDEAQPLWCGAPSMSAFFISLALQKEVECLSKEQSETRRQAEKDHAALRAQVQLLESELEEQLSQHQGCAQQAEEVAALKQQMASLDKHLRSQRHFMDEQAAEREHEREEFQQEIQRLEEELRQAARPQPQGPQDSLNMPFIAEVELLQEKLREKSDGFNELVIKKELADRQVLIQEEEIKRLEEMNADWRREVVQLQEELETQREIVKELQKHKDTLEEQQTTHLLPVSTLQSELDRGKCPGSSRDSPPQSPEEQLEATQTSFLQQEGKVITSNAKFQLFLSLLFSDDNDMQKLNALLGKSNHSHLNISKINTYKNVFYLQGVCARNSEIEELKAIIENLQENQKQLRKDKAEEIERLHEVIGKLQQELSLMAPRGPEVSDVGLGSLQCELLCSQVVGGPCRQALRGELEAALAAKEALSQLLAEQARGHSQALEALQQQLRAVEKAAKGQLAELGHSTALREVEIESMASQIQEFEAVLKAKEATIAQRDLEIEAMHRGKAAHAAQLKSVLSALARFCHALEQQPLAWPAEPPELHRLRVQCVHLSHQLQVLNQQFLRCRMELDRPPLPETQLYPGPEGSNEPGGASDAEVPEQGVNIRQLALGPHDQDLDPQGGLQPVGILVRSEEEALCGHSSLASLLTICQRQLRSELLLVTSEICSSLRNGQQDKEKILKDCQQWKVDLIAQMKQLQEKLNQLIYSMTFQNVDSADCEFQQPLASSAFRFENSSSDGSHNGEETDKLPPIDIFNTNKTMDITDIKNQDSLIRNEMPDFPIQEKLELQDGSPLSASVHSSSHRDTAEPLKSQVRVLDLSSWSSPEVLRKDSALEPQPSLPQTPGSDILSLRIADTPLQDRTSLLQMDEPGMLCYPDMSAAGQDPPWAASPPPEHHSVARTAVEKDVEDFIITSFDCQETLPSPSLRLEGKNDGNDESEGSSFRGKLSPQSGTPKAPADGPVSRRSLQPPGAMKGKDIPALQVKALLQMVREESRQILALSEGHSLPSALSGGEPRTALGAPWEGQGLLEAAPHKGDKGASDVCLDWRGECLQIIREVFDEARETLMRQLQPGLSGLDTGSRDYLFERLEKVVREQGDPQEKSLEHLRLSDRSSLLGEIQALRAQLRLTHLQNQEKLQQLCAALTSVEARGSWQEHQLRRQVELLAYKVEQEKCIASDLQKTLREEQEKANSVRKLLVAEQSSSRDLKAELSECRQESERLLQSLDSVQQEVLQLRSMLDSKESDLQAALQELEHERGQERALQSRLEEEQQRHLQQEGQSSQSLEEVRASLEEQRAQSSRLRVALKHEQTAKDNLQKELRIEHSRFEALLAQERGRLCELQKDLEAEKSHALELSEALQHERRLTEQLSRRAQEDSPAQRALLRRLQEEETHVGELQALLGTLQQQLEAEAQRRCEELWREKEVSATSTTAMEALQPQKRELRFCLEREREKPARLQADLEQVHTRWREQGGPEDARSGVETRQSQAEAGEWSRWHRDKEKLRELELQRQREEHKIQQLQRTVRELESKEEALRSGGPHQDAPRRVDNPSEPDQLREQQQELETIRQQLLCATGLLTSFVRQTVGRTINDWTSSNEKAVASLLRTLEELRPELSRSTSSQKKMAAELQIQLMDVLLKDNDSLTKALSTVTREKSELSRAVSRLEKILKHHVQKGCVLSRSDRSAWKQDGMVLQSSPQHSDPRRPPPAASMEANSCNVKMEKLYLRYLRAESFRKALIYQKKYLLLLIGGFQDSEQETLSMIAHLGVFPSKPDKKITSSRPFTKFRTAVRVVIAVLRLRFLVKKWQEVDRRGALAQGKTPRPDNSGGGPRVLRQQRAPPESRESPPTRDISSGHARDPVLGHGPATAASPRSTQSPNSRLERSLTASEDPEHSLTEYIHHLEMIQQRLGGSSPDLDSTSKKSCHRKIKQ